MTGLTDPLDDFYRRFPDLDRDVEARRADLYGDLTTRPGTPLDAELAQLLGEHGIEGGCVVAFRERDDGTLEAVHVDTVDGLTPDDEETVQ